MSEVGSVDNKSISLSMAECSRWVLNSIGKARDSLFALYTVERGVSVCVCVFSVQCPASTVPCACPCARKLFFMWVLLRAHADCRLMPNRRMTVSNSHKLEQAARPLSPMSEKWITNTTPTSIVASQTSDNLLHFNNNAGPATTFTIHRLKVLTKSHIYIQ